MNNVEDNMKMLDEISKRNMKFDGRADYRKGLKMERERILKIIDNFCFGDTEDTLEVKRSLHDAILGVEE